MSDNKGKKNTWLSSVIIGIAFLAIAFGLVISMKNKGYDALKKSVQNEMVSFVSTWAAEINGELETSKDFGNVLAAYMSDNKLAMDSEEVLALATEMVGSSDFTKIVFAAKDGSLIDNSGNEISTTGIEGCLLKEGSPDFAVYYLELQEEFGGKVFSTTYKLNEENEGIIFFLPVENASKGLKKAGYSDTSFGVIFQKDGTVLNFVNGFTDKDSKFVASGNFLSNIQESVEREDYNIFKTKLYNGSSYFVEGKLDDESRTIASAPLGTGEIYFGMGTRQYYVDSMINAGFKDINGTSVKLLIVLSIFMIIVLTAVIIAAIKSKEKGKKLEDKADMDLLTELTNKAATERLITEYIEDKPQGHGVLFILDIDNFKKVNDTMGHAFGDTLLKTLGKEIRTEFRVTDIVGRTGGDEFMIFLKDINDDLIIEREANKLIRFFHDFKAGGDYVKYSATASIGAAIYPNDGAQFKDLYVSADQALYRAKKRGKNQLVFFDEEKYGKDKG